MNNTSGILLQFEDILKKCILDYFKNVLSNDKIVLLVGKKYIDGIDFTKLNTRELIQGTILRDILNDVVNVTCTKELNGQNCMYGEYVNSLLIEYYARDISNKYKFSINVNEEYNDKNGFITLLQNVCKENFNKYILNFKIDKILTLNGLENLSNYLDSQFNEKYNNNTIPNNTINENNNVDTNENKISNSPNISDNAYYDNNGKLGFVSQNGKEYLVFVDSDSKQTVHELESNSNVHSYFIDRVHGLENNSDLKSNILYLELLDILNNEKEKNNVSKAVDETINNLDYTTILDVNDVNENVVLNMEKLDDSNVRKLTPKEYENLCIKYASGEELTPDQLNLLKSNSPELLEDIEESNVIKKSAGIINKKMIILFSCIGISILSIILLLILK